MAYRFLGTYIAQGPAPVWIDPDIYSGLDLGRAVLKIRVFNNGTLPIFLVPRGAVANGQISTLKIAVGDVEEFRNLDGAFGEYDLIQTVVNPGNDPDMDVRVDMFLDHEASV